MKQGNVLSESKPIAGRISHSSRNILPPALRDFVEKNTQPTRMSEKPRFMLKTTSQERGKLIGQKQTMSRQSNRPENALTESEYQMGTYSSRATLNAHKRENSRESNGYTSLTKLLEKRDLKGFVTPTTTNTANNSDTCAFGRPKQNASAPHELGTKFGSGKGERLSLTEKLNRNAQRNSLSRGKQSKPTNFLAANFEPVKMNQDFERVGGEYNLWNAQERESAPILLTKANFMNYQDKRFELSGKASGSKQISADRSEGNLLSGRGHKRELSNGKGSQQFLQAPVTRETQQLVVKQEPLPSSQHQRTNSRTRAPQRNPFQAEFEEVFMACRERKFEVLKTMLRILDCKAPQNSLDEIINRKDEDGMCLVHYAVQNRHKELLIFLQSRHADFDVQDTNGITPLMMLATSSWPEGHKIVVECTQHPNKQDNYGSTALHYAVVKKNLELITDLLDSRKEIEVRRKNNEGDQPIDLADTALLIRLESMFKKYERARSEKIFETDSFERNRSINSILNSENFSNWNLEEDNNQNSQATPKAVNKDGGSTPKKMRDSKEDLQCGLKRTNSNNFLNLNQPLQNKNATEALAPENSTQRGFSKTRKLDNDHATGKTVEAVNALTERNAPALPKLTIETQQLNSKAANSARSLKSPMSGGKSDFLNKLAIVTSSASAKAKNQQPKAQLFAKRVNPEICGNDIQEPSKQQNQAFAKQSLTAYLAAQKQTPAKPAFNFNKNVKLGLPSVDDIYHKSEQSTAQAERLSVPVNFGIKKPRPIQSTNDGSIESTLFEGQIDLNSFIVHTIIGTGSFGKVYLVQKKNSSHFYALKSLSKEQIFKNNLTRYAMTERNVLRSISHPFIVKLRYSFQNSKNLFLVMDYMPGGDLGFYLQRDEKFSERRAKVYTAEIILAISELHRHNIIFRDLKPDNLLLDQDGHIMLSDFGLSKENVRHENNEKSFCGTFAYLAPEMVKKTGHGKSMDWYLLGTLVYEMVTGVPPYYSENKDELFENIKNANLKFPCIISADLKDLIMRLLERDPKKRIKEADIKTHPWFKDINWDDVYNRRLVPPKPHIEKRQLSQVKPDDEIYRGQDSDKNGISHWTFVENYDHETLNNA